MKKNRQVMPLEGEGFVKACRTLHVWRSYGSC